MKISALKKMASEHCEKCCEHHVALGKAHRAAAKDSSSEVDQLFHKAAAEAHVAHAEYFLECAKTVKDMDDGEPTGKAFGMFAARDADELAPTNAHAMLVDNPMAKLIPRTGQPLVLPDDNDPTAAMDKAMGRNG